VELLSNKIAFKKRAGMPAVPFRGCVMSVENGRSLYELLTAWQGAIAPGSQPQPPAYDGPDVLIRDLVEHTNDVRPGSCFVARVRSGSDGHPYIPQAIERGAALIIGQQDPAGLDFPLTVPYLQVEDSGLVYEIGRASCRER